MTDKVESSLTSVASSYLNYLPACYGSADPSGELPFLALYLKVFEKLLSGIADGADLEQADRNLDAAVAYRAGIRALLDANVIGNMFYPRWSFLFPDSDPSVFMPPLSEVKIEKDKTALFNALANYFGLAKYDCNTNRLSPVEIWARSFLAWLGGTIGLSVDKNWTIDASRTVIAHTFPYDRARGTPMGMTWLLNACVSACAAPVEGVTLAKLSVIDCFRPALIVCDEDANVPPAFHIFNSYPDHENVVIISDLVGPEVDFESAGPTFDVNDSKLVAYVPWRFEVEISLTAEAGVIPTDQRRALIAYYRLLRPVLDMAKPALTTYMVNFTLNVQGQQNQQANQRRFRYGVGTADRLDMVEDI